MRRALAYIAGILICAMAPGAGEIVENVVHLLAEGRAAHELADADHAPQGSEHGCSGTFHRCHCHSSTAFVGDAEAPEIEAAIFCYSQPIELQVQELISGVRSDVASHIYGDDLELLKDKADEVVRVLQEVPERRTSRPSKPKSCPFFGSGSIGKPLLAMESMQGSCST
jgi:hypothetical protein